MIKRTWILLAAVLCAGRANAESALDRAEVLRRAQKTAPVLAIAKAQVDQAKAGTKGTTMLSVENPSLSILGGVRFGDPKTPEMRGQVGIPVDLGGRPRARLAAADASLKVAVAEAEDAARLTVREALLRWARAVRDAKLFSLAQARLAISDGLLDAAKKRVAAKDLGTGDLAIVELERTRDAASVAQARGTAQASAITLGAYIGVGGDPVVSGELVDDSSLPTLDTLLGSIDARPDVRALAAEVGEARARSGLAKADRWPTLTLIGTYEYHESTNFLLVGVSMPLPLFNANTQNVSTSTAAIEVADARLAALRASAVGEVRAAWKRWNAAREALTLIRSTTAPAAAAVDATSQSFVGGKTGFIEVLLVRRIANDAAVDRISAELTYAEARIELEAAAGKLP